MGSAQRLARTKLHKPYPQGAGAPDRGGHGVGITNQNKLLIFSSEKQYDNCSHVWAEKAFTSSEGRRKQARASLSMAQLPQGPPPHAWCRPGPLLAMYRRRGGQPHLVPGHFWPLAGPQWPELLNKRVGQALASVAQLLEHHPVKQKVTSSTPGQGTRLGCGFSFW